MKTALIVFLLTLLTAFGQAPPYQRQFFDTNTDPVLQVTAGSNCWVTFSTTEPIGQVRTFRVDVPSSAGGTTNIILISTNLVFDVNMGAEVDGYTQGVYSLRIGDTNYFRNLIGGETYGIMVYSNRDGIILSNLYPNIFWFTNTLLTNYVWTNADGSVSRVADGNISNNYNVAIYGKLSLHGGDTNSIGNAGWYTNPFIEFRVNGRNWSNTFVGVQAGMQNYAGAGNTFMGWNAGSSNLDGNYNTFIGANAGARLTNQHLNTAIGFSAMKDAWFGAQNTIVGNQAAQNQKTASGNSALGYFALSANNNSSHNVAVGVSAGEKITSGDGHNVAIGELAMQSATNMSWNVAVGDHAITSGQGSNNVAIGQYSMGTVVGVSNTALGDYALPVTFTGDGNTAIGASAGRGFVSGNHNLFLGSAIGIVDRTTFTASSNILMGAGGRIKASFDYVNNWKFEESLSARYNLMATQSVLIGYRSMTPVTNYFGTNIAESFRIPATNIQFRLLVPSNVCTVVTNGNDPVYNIQSNTVYGTTGDALINVPFYTASASTNAPAWNEFVTRDYVDTHSTTGGVASSLSVKTNGTVFSAGVSNLNFIGASGSNGPDGTANITITGGGSTNFVYQNYGFATTNFVYTTTNTEWGAIQDFVTNTILPDLTGVVFDDGGDTNKAGLNSVAYGSSVAIGNGPRATDNSVAIGVSPIADAYGIAIGYNAIGTNSGVAIGNAARAGAGDYNIAIGHLAQIETAGFTRTTQIGPRTGNSSSNGFLHYLDWPYLDRSGLGNFSNLVTVKEYVSDSLIVTNRAVSGTNGPNNGTNQTVITWNNFAQTNGSDRVVITNGTFSASSTVRAVDNASGYVLLDASGMNISRANARITGGGNGLRLNVYDGVNDTNTITIASPSRLVTIGREATIGGAFTSTSTSTSAPAATEFVVAEWVRGLFSGGQLLYNCTNQQPYFTNMDLWYSALPTTNTVAQARTYNSVTNGQYLGTGIATTNRYQQVNSPMTVNAYLSFNTGGGRAVTVHPELYYCYTEPGTNGPGNYTNLLGDYSAGGQALIAGTNLYTWVVSFPTIVSTNASGFWVLRRFKVDSQANNPNVTIHGSGNTPSTIGFQNPASTSSSGNYIVSSNGIGTNLTIYGDQYITNAIIATNSGLMFLGAGGGINPWGTNSVRVYSGTNLWMHDFAREGSDAHNVFIGEKAGNLTLTNSTDPHDASYNVGIGYLALNSLSNAWDVTAVGANAGRSLLSATSDTLIGCNAGLSLTAASGNTLIGMNAGRSLTVSGNITAIGHAAMFGQVDTASADCAFGYEAMYGSAASATFDNAFGYQAMRSITTGDYNDAFGNSALYAITTGSSNAAFGDLAGRYAAYGTNGTTPNIVPNKSIYIGAFSRAYSSNGLNEIVIGADAVGNGNNSVTIGNASTTNTYFQGNVAIPGTVTATNGLLWPTNALGAASGYQIQMGKYQSFVTNDNFTLGELANVVAGVVNEGVLIITNNVNPQANKTVATPADWVGGGTFTITNQAVISVVVYPNFATNVVFRCLK